MSDAIPVAIEAKVTIPPAPDPTPQRQPSVAPTTTYQQDLTTDGQRRVNLLWERTQSTIALFVVFSTLTVAAIQAIRQPSEQLPTIFSVAFGTVVGFYFSRTNHQAIGGSGPKPDQPYIGR